MPNPSRTTFSLHKISDPKIISFSAHEFSKLKFGNEDVAHRFGVALADAFIAQHLSSCSTGQLAVAVSYNSIPTAAYLLRKHFMSQLNRWLATNHLQSSQKVHIRREPNPHNSVDYGTLSNNARVEVIERDTFHIDKDWMSNKTIIVVDDIRVTGAHERRIQRMFDEQGIQNRTFFVYFAELVNEQIDPTFENTLNHSTVQSLSEVEKIQKNGAFAWTVRFVKYVLSSDRHEFGAFMERQDKNFNNRLLDFAISEGYQNLEKYRKNFELLFQSV